MPKFTIEAGEKRSISLYLVTKMKTGKLILKSFSIEPNIPNTPAGHSVPSPEKNEPQE